MTAFALLRAVRADLADEAHWKKGTFWDNGACCIVGAGIIAHSKTGPDRERFVMDSYARMLGFDNWGLLAAWNDAPTTTHADIIARLGEAIEREGK